MAKIIDNPKEFLVIDTTAAETAKFGGYGTCDYCNGPSQEGVLICVLNQWYCKKCYDTWLKTAKRYKEDIPFEKRNFEYYKKLLNIK